MLSFTRKWITKTSRILSYYICICYNCNPFMEKLDKDVSEANWKNTTPFVPPIKACKVIKVYDGDSITVAAKLHESFSVNRFSVRLNGIDTPEMRAQNENEKKRAFIAKDFLEKRILNQTVYLEDVGLEKYGRLLATVIHDGNNINEMMIENNHAYRYTGGKKKPPSEWYEDL